MNSFNTRNFRFEISYSFTPAMLRFPFRTYDLYKPSIKVVRTDAEFDF